MLRQTGFVKCIYIGRSRVVSKKKIVFFNVDFVDSYGIVWNIREFPDGELRDKLLLIVDMLSKRVKRGTEIIAD